MFVYRELKLRAAATACCVAAAKTTSIVIFLIAAALVSAWLITTSNIPAADRRACSSRSWATRSLLMFVIMVLVVIVGTALDFTPTVLILTPVLMPVVKQAGIDPVYFGVLFIMNNAIGLITPPVGIVLNVICGVAKISMSELMKGLWPFLWAELIVLFLLVLFPPLVMLPLKWLTLNRPSTRSIKETDHEDRCSTAPCSIRSRWPRRRRPARRAAGAGAVPGAHAAPVGAGVRRSTRTATASPRCRPARSRRAAAS